MDNEKDSSFWKNNVKNILDVILGNPRLTPIILLILAVVPLLMLALIVLLTFSSPIVQ